MISTEQPILATRAQALDDSLLVVTARDFRIRWEECSAKLATATAEERARLTLSPSGYGIHWPLLDEDLSVTGLVRKSGG